MDSTLTDCLTECSETYAQLPKYSYMEQVYMHACFVTVARLLIAMNNKYVTGFEITHLPRTIINNQKYRF